MLIEFKITNFRSIRDTQTLSMAASTGAELPQNICPSDFDSNLRLVRSAVVYGPNAAGKSNLINALYFVRRFILSSAKELQQGEKISVKSFLFDEESCQQPSEFEIIFSKDGVRYQYGFMLNEDRVIEEWLYAYPLGRPQLWFAREFDSTAEKYRWEFKKSFKGSKQQQQLWESSTRSNALFLSTAVQLNNEQLIPVFSWFQKDLIVIPTSREPTLGKSISHIESLKDKQKIMKYMNIADPSISNITVETEKFSENRFPKGMPQEIKEILIKDIAGKEMKKISFIHPGNTILDFEDESDGTCRLFAFSGHWIDVLEKGKVIIVDELNNSLHPLLVRFLISLICNPEINKNNAQLIFSTHDTSLLDNEIFRRDQIWFVEKNKKHATQLYPLLDFSPRKPEAIGKGYLQGRYGALPYVSKWQF